MIFCGSGKTRLWCAFLLAVLSIFSAAHAATDPSLKLAINRTEQDLVVSWFGAGAVPYQLESSSNLIAWAQEGAAITGANTLAFVTNAIAGEDRFYRVTRLFPAASGTAAFNPATGLLTIVGDDADNVITVSLNGNLIVVNGGAMAITGGVPTLTNTVLIQVLGCDGNDQITIAGGLPPAHLFGDTGNDTLIGGSAAEIFVGGPGNDFVDGNGGSDIAYLGEGDDTFQWDPGDGSDIVEGQSGNDALVFNGSNVSELIDLSAIGSRVRLGRNIATIVMDLDGVERIDFRASGGADGVVVNNLTGTAVSQINLDLAGAGGTGDSQVDVVTINGTPGPDIINVATNGGALEISGLTALVRVLNPEAAYDLVVLSGSGGDLVNINGSALADIMTVTPSPVSGYARAIVQGFNAPVDVGTNASTLSINGLGGPDNISASGGLAALGLPLRLDGGDGNDILIGSNGADLLLGGPGDDYVDGKQGSDTVFLGADNDTFQWDPGDGSDTVDGESGNDILLFNGANINESINLSNNGARLRFTRDIATVTLDVDGVERVDVRALGGADTIVVNSLAGTVVTQVNVDLSVAGGAGDAQADAVVLNGTAGVETFNLTNNAGTLEAVCAAVQVRLLNAEFANDRLVINGVGGDLVNVNGSALADTITFLPSPLAGYLRASSTGYIAPVDVTGALTLSLNGLGGSDTISGSGYVAALAIPIQLDGGDDNDYISGSDANELILGGAGNDLIAGNAGNDTVLMGDDADTFFWDAGDGNDIVEGQGGNDALVLNGTPVNEIIDFSAVGSRLRLSRNVENVVLDIDGVERLGLQPLGGADVVTVNSLAGTAVESLIIELTGIDGGSTGDGQADLITVNGTDLPDVINLTANAGVIDMEGVVPSLQIRHAEAANDSLIVNGLGGTDIFNIGSGVTALMTVVTNQN